MTIQYHSYRPQLRIWLGATRFKNTTSIFVTQASVWWCDALLCVSLREVGKKMCQGNTPIRIDRVKPISTGRVLQEQLNGIRGSSDDGPVKYGASFNVFPIHWGI